MWLTLQQAIFSQMNKMLHLRYHGIFCIIWRVKVFTKCFHGKSVCPVICLATGKENPARFVETVILCEAFCGIFKSKLGSSLCYHTISMCLDLFNISIRLFSILLFQCSAIFGFSFKHSEHLLLLVLYAWCLPKISHVIFSLRLLSFISKTH